MAQNTVSSERIRETLSSVRTGMTVWDRDGHKVGKVKDIQFAYGFGDTTPKSTEFYRLPSELQTSLMRDGFIQIEAGLFSRDRFAGAELIAEMRDEGLILNVMGDTLMKS
jgi:hypothetical protein